MMRLLKVALWYSGSFSQVDIAQQCHGPDLSDRDQGVEKRLGRCSLSRHRRMMSPLTACYNCIMRVLLFISFSPLGGRSIGYRERES